MLELLHDTGSRFTWTKQAASPPFGHPASKQIYPVQWEGLQSTDTCFWAGFIYTTRVAMGKNQGCVNSLYRALTQ